MKINGAERTPGLAEAAPANHLAAMSLTETLALLAAVLAVAVLAGWRGARPSQPHHGVRMVPWRLIMVTAAVAAFVLLVHLAALLGLPQRPPV